MRQRSQRNKRSLRPNRGKTHNSWNMKLFERDQCPASACPSHSQPGSSHRPFCWHFMCRPCHVDIRMLQLQSDPNLHGHLRLVAVECGKASRIEQRLITAFGLARHTEARSSLQSSCSYVLSPDSHPSDLLASDLLSGWLVSSERDDSKRSHTDTSIEDVVFADHLRGGIRSSMEDAKDSKKRLTLSTLMRGPTASGLSDLAISDASTFGISNLAFFGALR